MGRYASQEAYEQALSTADSTNAPALLKVKFGQSSTSPNSGSPDVTSSHVDSEGVTQANESLEEVNPPPLPTENMPNVHEEAANYDGDRVLANSILFLQDFGLWTEIAYAVPEGDIGRAFEIMKVNNLAYFCGCRALT